MPEQEIDPQLVDRTRREIGKLVTEIEQLAMQDMPPVEFFAEFSRRVSAALAARATAVWTMGAGNLQLQFQINLQSVGFETEGPNRQSHDELLRHSMAHQRAMIVPPHSGPGDTDESLHIQNPTDSLLVVAPIILDGESVGIVEVFQDPNRRSSAQQGYLQFLTRIANEASRFLKNRQFREIRAEQQLWDQLELFAKSVHGGLNPTQVAYLIANDGKKYIQSERVSVAVRRGKKTKIEAISGQDTVEKRSNLVTRMAKLADKVLKHGENLIYQEKIEDHWPKDTVQALEHYLDESGSKLIAVVPMPDEREFGTRGKADAALIVEMIEDAASPEHMGARVEAVARHGSIALYNALEYHRIFLLPLWRGIGNTASWLTGHRFPKVVIALILLVVTAVCMVVVPWPLRLEGRGELVPDSRQSVYAPVSGIIKEVKVRHKDEVERGTLLAIMSNPELEREEIKLLGELRAAEDLLKSMKLEASRNPTDQEVKGKVDTQEQQITSLKQQLQLVESQKKELRVESPIRGQVMDFEPEKLLLRPVQQGDVLMMIADTQGEWILDINLPENTITHITRATRANDGEPLPVTFVVSSSPDYTYEGTLTEIATQAIPQEEENVIGAKVTLNTDQELPALRSGLVVRAKVNCGPHAVGYVLFREVIDFVREYVFF